MDISRKGFLKLLGFGTLGIALGLKSEAKINDIEQHVTNESEVVNEAEVIRYRREIEVLNENDGWIQTRFRFPIVKTLTFKERENSWIQVIAINKEEKELSILEVPTILVGSEGKFNLGIPVVGNIKAYIHGD